MNEIVDSKIIVDGPNQVRIIVNNIILDNDSLSWHNENYELYDERYLSLSEISNQVLKVYKDCVLYVWEESPSEGYIYQYGNYKKKQWLKHGTTRG
ncbi:hypothetical protein, partial [uncultured Clostridium sp.]|uniref:hypothetical protein n=1 Tax=uncultured Clostridium sp. TaxID=59620 RepID=UPI0028EA8F18